MARLPLPARIYTWSVILAGLCLLAVLFAMWVPEMKNPVELAGALTASTALVVALAYVGLHPVLLAPNQKMNVGTALMFGALLTLAPFPAAALSVIGTGIHNVLIRRRWHNVLFNMAQHSLTVGAAALVFRTLDPDGDFILVDARDILAGVAAGCVYFFVSTSVVGFMVRLGHNRRLSEALGGLWRQ
ncbi:MAG: hypothetical protein NTZ05_17260, partial [Chloroflexi bacterium]|nr:hypothetical protein [Chloroflexota bacterium]